MANKYYAVRVGKKAGIYRSWEECKEQVHGFSGAQYKSFKNIEDAKEYVNPDGQIPRKQSENNIEKASAYVDGSFNTERKEYAYGAVIFWNKQEYHFSNRYDDEELAKMHNVAGELKGSERAMQFAVDHKIKELTIYYDYEGIEKWATGEWKAKQAGTQAYKKFCDQVREDVNIKFVKVEAHSGDKYNELADQLATEAFEKALAKEYMKVL